MPSTGKKTKKVMAIRTSKTERDGLQFPVGRVHRLLRRGHYAQRIGIGAGVYLVAVLEFQSAEILEMAGKAARTNGRVRVMPRHIELVVRNDKELNKLFASVTIAGKGVLPNILAQLLYKRTSEVPSAGKEAAPSQKKSSNN